MIVCVTSAGRDLNSRVDERFGRADYLDTETMSAEVVTNTAQAAGRVAGIGAAQS